MLHHERLKPPIQDYPPNEWSLIEASFKPEFTAQTEAVLALGNGYLGMRGNPEEGSPSVENGTFVNGFYESWPIVYAEEAYGFARTGQTMLNVTDSKIIKLFVDDEPFSLADANIRHYDRRLNMKSGTLDREVLWETHSGMQVRIKSRRLISFQQRHAAAIFYEVTLINGTAPVVISSEMQSPQSGDRERPMTHVRRKFSRERYYNTVRTSLGTAESSLSTALNGPEWSWPAASTMTLKAIGHIIAEPSTRRILVKSRSRLMLNREARSASRSTWCITPRRPLLPTRSAVARNGRWIVL